MTDILQEIIAHKREELVERQTRLGLAELQAAVALTAPPRNFVGAVRARMAQ
ncbi:indole-3-glycerol-phosphate synthase TrpC, partial [Acidithiobacillus ferrooxidans]|nr:indole-3-glycerol-phosphate synthase TrpC [Acidithiobacillus ferrooxidans]